MKKQKIFIVLALAVLSFSNAGAQKTRMVRQEIPLEIANYISQHFKEYKVKRVVKKVENEIPEYEIKLNRKVELEFDEAFKIKEIESKKEFQPAPFRPPLLTMCRRITLP